MLKRIIFSVVFLISFYAFSQEKPYYDDVQKFVNYDKVNPPQKGMVLFIGSSTFTYWGNDAAIDFKNNKIVNRAFGGSTLEDLIYYQNEIIFGYQPSKIVIYCGENDIANDYKNLSSSDVANRFIELYTSIRKKFPKIPVVYMGIKPSPSRWDMRDKMIETNSLIQKYLDKKPNVHFVPIWNKLLDKSGKPDVSLYIEDELHLNKKGYKILTHNLEKFVND